MERHLAIINILLILMLSSLSAQDSNVKVYVVGHGWHTGLIIPISQIKTETCPGLQPFDGWEYVEIGWGDEGFYRGAESISLEVAFAAVATPTPTVLHIVGVHPPVEDAFPASEMICLHLDKNQFSKMVNFINATFHMKAGAPVDLGKGIYGSSRFFRAEGSYYFPNTCNVWTLKAIKAAGFPVTPAMGVRTENVLNQSAKFGTTIRRSPGRSRIIVLISAALAGLVAYRFQNLKRLALCAWGCLFLALLTTAAATMMSVNQIDLPKSVPTIAALSCWTSVALVSFAHFKLLHKRFRWRHTALAIIALLTILIGLSPL